MIIDEQVYFVPRSLLDELLSQRAFGRLVCQDEMSVAFQSQVSGRQLMSDFEQVLDADFSPVLGRTRIELGDPC
jgi:hypothetical protein